MTGSRIRHAIGQSLQRLTNTLRLLLLLGCISPSVTALELLGFEHQRLDDGQFENLEYLKGKPTLMMFYKPDCPWCSRQGKAFNQLLARCGDKLQVVALGTLGDKTRLRQEWWKMKPAFAGFVAGTTMMESMGELPATPLTLVTNARGELITYLRGYIKPAQMNTILQETLALECATVATQAQ
ncbi:TlpA family protein disulfide reductase [Shewanella sp. GXUN23E]|uniref:TlpA family protein disulfide reductase n=1 Tax=Shewanella sp. GXUN23E TaxID=3422498 RepID=UPI003D7DF06C